jgi:hypothetical protein
MDFSFSREGARNRARLAPSLPLYSIVPFGKDEQNLFCQMAGQL